MTGSRKARGMSTQRLVADRLGPRDKLTAFELNPREAQALKAALAGRRGVAVREADGWRVAPQRGWVETLPPRLRRAAGGGVTPPRRGQ